MTKPAALFVAVAMAVSAACVGVIAFFGVGVSFGSSALSSFGALGLMALLHLAFMRGAPQDDGRLEDIDRVVTDLQSRLTTMEARMATLDAAGGERARSATRPIVEELAALGGLVTTLAKEVSAHDVRFAKMEIAAQRSPAQKPPPPVQVAAPPPPPPVASAPSPFVAPPPPVEPAPEVAVEPNAYPKRIGKRAKLAPSVRPPTPPIQQAYDPDEFDPDQEQDAAPAAPPPPVVDLGVRKRFERALSDGRINIHLQPIVALPSRRTLHYEALARLTEGDGEIEARAFVGQAAAEGLAGAIDKVVLERAADVAVRLAASGRTGTVFVNIAPETLDDRQALDEIAAIIEDRSELARLLVLEFGHRAFRNFGNAERAALGRFLERGVRLSIDRAESVKFNPGELAAFGVRFVKVSAGMLLDPESARGASIHPADLSGLMVRHGIELIATHVEEERTVPELLDMDVKAGQGFLFGGARPVRPPASGQRDAGRDEAPARRMSPPRSASGR